MQCDKCGSTKINKNGKITLSNGVKQKYKCRDCGTNFSLMEHSIEDSRFLPEHILNGDKFVITSVQNNTELNDEFYKSLRLYCEKNNAKLLIIPTLHKQMEYMEDEITWFIDEANLLREKVSLNGKITILSTIKINQSAENPLGGLDSLSKGKSLIVPHNQLQMRSLPVSNDNMPIVMITTGTITKPNYTRSKAGEKAEFNHSYSAIVVEFDEDIFHMRVLNSDEYGGFYDISGYYIGDSFEPLSKVEALITGDEHVLVNCLEVSGATYFDKDSMVNILKPEYIIRHDVLDCFTISHHHRRDNFLQYSKYMNSLNSIEEELEITINYVRLTTPQSSKSVIISSNHHDHLKRWLNEADPKLEPWNAKIFHKLTYLMLEEIEKTPHISSPDPFILYFNSKYPDYIKSIDRNETFKIKGIELSNHGDVGANGSRGSLTQFARFSDKMIIGHSHTPGINKGAYSVGCSTPKKLEYTNGPSSWMNTHCVIYPNGKRQLLNIIKGKWKK